jgi:DNA-binding NtrC family response regulator
MARQRAELVNVVERAVLLSPGSEIRLTDLPTAISSQAPATAAFQPLGSPLTCEAPPSWLGKPLHDARQRAVDDFESRYLSHLLQETGGRICETARRAGINERSLYELMRRHHLHKEDFRPGRPGGA